MTIPGFTADSALYRSSGQYLSAREARLFGQGVVPQIPFMACLFYAGLCLAITEDPLAAGYCWWDYANRCGGGDA